MFRSRNDSAEPEADVVRPTVTTDPALRDERDPDPTVDEAVERLRRDVSELVAYDEWGRPLAWRHVARIVLGPLVSDLRDSQTAARLGQHIAEPVAQAQAQVEESDAPAASVEMPPASIQLPETAAGVPAAPVDAPAPFSPPVAPPATPSASAGLGWPA